ncbi:Cytosine/adenosine deaminase [Duganella sp. CF402]|uniref:8-oxoguanine deaminase n=1 Tax=unclassified Duganella TaxID=2636909 RepID=UPI0008B2DA89|nr:MULTISPECIES: 8-oxoguanine deaminase [unclassified Duganella]RZT10713.1 cytosine/adenosine deaminase-related metal-dependent hydrolase [Duganella sp. BK701]SEL00633.1 Cytosine/adenosine deaminase [Duganella sp. CF402]
MKTLLIKNARVLVTMDDTRREIANGAVFIRDNVIEQVGASADLPQTADEVIDATGHVVMPGLVNTHHHMYQSLTRAIPAAQNGELFNWLTNLYPLWAGLTAEMVHVSTLTAMAELILSGCTTSSDHLYIYPNDCKLDDSIEAAQKIGMRFHASRGSMSVGQSKGGLPPDRVVEEEGAILKDTQRLIETYNDASRHAMQRIVVAPCSPFSVSQHLMKESAKLARSYGVSMHTHLAENVNDIAYSREKFNMTPAEYAEDCGWVGPDVWHAHCVQLDDDGIYLFARTGTGIAHCPCSNMRLASGIAPIRKMLDRGVSVGLGVDGSASNDAGHMMGEVRQAMLLQRVGFGPDAMTARQALEVATLGGAKVLNRDDIGAIKPGMSADIVMFKLDGIGMAGALHDPVAALVFCTPPNVACSIINGKVVVRDGQLCTIDLPVIIERHNKLASQLAIGAAG